MSRIPLHKINQHCTDSPQKPEIQLPRFSLFFHGCLGEFLPEMAEAIFTEGWTQLIRQSSTAMLVHV